MFLLGQNHTNPSVTLFCRNSEALESVVRNDDFLDWARLVTIFGKIEVSGKSEAFFLE